MFVCLRPIFLYFVNPLNLIFAWVCYSCFGVFNQLKSSIRLVCLRPIFPYLFKNLFWNKCCFSVFAYPWPKFPSVVLKSWAFGVYSHTLFFNMVLNKFCFGVSNILELSIVLVCLRPIFLQSFSVIVIKRFLNNNCWNNSCFGVLNKLKFSMTSVCLRPIFLNFFTNLLLNIFVSVSPSDYFLISSIWFLKFLPVFWIFNVMREVLLSRFKVCLTVALSMSYWCVKHLQGNFMPELCFTRCSKAASLTDWVKEFFMGCNVGFPK